MIVCSGIVIIDNRRGETEVPFVEVYGGMAYNYENPEGEAD